MGSAAVRNTGSLADAARALGARVAAALCALAAAQAQAQSQALIGEILDFDRAALVIEQHLRHADATGLSVYIGAEADDLLVRRVSLRIDEQEAIAYEYGADESDALQVRGLHRLLSTPLTPGSHRLRVEMIARHVDARPQTPRIRALLDQTFDKADLAQALEVTLTGGGMVREPVLRLRAAVEPQLREADFLMATKAPLAAAQVLTELELSGAAVAADAFTLRRAAAMQALGRAESGAAAGDDERAIYVRYNRAVEQIANGQLDAGIAVLDELGRIELEDIESRALRDRANVALGYLLLRQHRGAEAIPVFQRVRSPGPYGNPALLGLGWAYLMPRAAEPPAAAANDATWVAAADEATAVRRRLPFRYSWSVAAGEREQDVRKALAAWNELSGRDVFEPAVQEGMLAVPYALDHIGAHEQAQQRQLQAIETLAGARATLDAALSEVSSGAMLAAIEGRTADGWRRRLADLPYDERTAYFRILTGDHRFLDALETHRLLRDLAGMLEQHQRRLRELGTPADALTARATQLRARVDAQLQHQQSVLADAAASVLHARRRDTDRYLAEARFALARAHDPSARALARAPEGAGSR